MAPATYARGPWPQYTTTGLALGMSDVRAAIDQNGM